MKLTDFLKNLKDIALEKPFCFSLVAFLIFFLCFYTLSVFELVPEHENMRLRNENERAIDKGDHLSWLGMEVAPLTRDIRKEFNIPRKVKGVFVLNEGIGRAKKEGVQTGDIICAINRRTVTGQRSFLKVARETKYYDGILLDLYRDKKKLYVTIPFTYAYGPLMGPNKEHWQLGSPLADPVLPYGQFM